MNDPGWFILGFIAGWYTAILIIAYRIRKNNRKKHNPWQQSLKATAKLAKEDTIE